MNRTFTEKIVGTERYEARVLSLLERIDKLPSIWWLAKELHINYLTARALLLNMMLTKKIQGVKTASGVWVFYPIKNDGDSNS